MNDQVISLQRDFVSLDTILEEAGFKTGGPSGKGASFWSAFELCPYDARLKELYGNEAQGFLSPALITGILVHEGLAQWYLTRDPSRTLGPVNAVLNWAQEKLPSDMGDWAKVLWDCCQPAYRILDLASKREESPLPNTPTNLINPYYDFNRTSVKAVELLLEYNKDFHYSGRIDLMLEAIDVDGSPCAIIVDHKTVSEYTADWVDSFRQDLQFAGLPFLWNELMVPQNLPPCRYVIVSGYVKNPTNPAHRFVKHIYPVHDNRINAFYIQMQHNWALYQSCLEKEQKALQAGGPIDLASIWPQHYASCQSRRYGRRSASILPSYDGEFVSGGGRCDRFNYCLQLDMQTRMYTPPCKAVEPAVESSQLAGPPPLCEPSSLTDPLAGNTQTEGELRAPTAQPPAAPLPPNEVTDSPWKHPIPEDESYVVSMGVARGEMPLCDVPPGECVYLANGAAVFWNTGIVEDGQALLLRPNCPEPLRFDASQTAYVVDPIFKYPKKQQPAQQPVEPQPAAGEAKVEVVELPPSSVDVDLAPSNGGGSVGNIVGRAAMVGVGVVDVLYIGSFTRGGKALYPTMDKLWDERSAPFFGAVMIGRDETNRQLQVFSVPDKGSYTKAKKREIGEVVWSMIVDTIQETTV